MIFRANDSMSASLYSPQMTIDAPGHTYETTFQLSTKNLIPIDGGPSSGAATLTGNVYLHFFDINGDSGAWNPQLVRWPPRMLRIFVTANFRLFDCGNASNSSRLCTYVHILSESYVGRSSKGEARMSSLQIKDLGKM